MPFRMGIGHDSHRFETKKGKPLILGGIEFKGEKGLKGNSDTDVVLHTILAALGQILGKIYLGAYSDSLCEKGITNSGEYMKEPLKELKRRNYKITTVGITIECKRPRIEPVEREMRKSIAKVMGIDAGLVGVTATSGEGLTAFGKGEGIQCFAVVGAVREDVYKKLVGE